MPSFADLRQEHHLEMIRALMVRHPGVSVGTIRQHFLQQKQPIELDPKYVSETLRKFKAQRKHRQYGNVTQRLSEVEDLTREVQRELWGLARLGKEGKKPQLSASVSALLAIGKLEHELFQAQFDSGVFTRQIGTLKNEQIMDDESMKVLSTYVVEGLRQYYLRGRGAPRREPDQLLAVVPQGEERTGESH